MHIRKIPLTLTSAALAATVLALATPAFAQDPASTTPTEPAPTTQRRASSGGGGGGLGLGAAAFTSGLAGPNIVYDFGQFHIEGLFAFVRSPLGASTQTTFNLGGGGWYHLNMGDASDFSLGGTLGFLHNTAGSGTTTVLLEPGAMVRAFVTSNVALHGRLGVVFAFADGPDTIALDGQVAGGFGVTYFWR
jgi:hypothetical protein